VALVLDASSSMGDEVGAGRTKLDAAHQAVLHFLDQLALADGDRAAVVTFNADAEVRQGLTASRARLEGALRGIELRELTRIHRGIQEAHAELAAHGRPDAARTMIVLTDGLSNPEPSAVAVAAAAAAKQVGIVLFTIGLGAEVDAAALRTMASEPAYSYPAPTADALGAIYRRIAVTLPCPPVPAWP
jgi:Mg-chelatase subunit ChlD